MLEHIKSSRSAALESNQQEQERIVSRKDNGKDMWQQSLRPKFFRDYIGQETLRNNLSVYIEAAKKRKEALDHVLLYGPPGLGKTTMANILANELGFNFRVTSVLWIDEIHRLNSSVEEILYPAMEDFALDIVMGKGPGARSYRLDLPPFTLVGATTRAGALAAPLRDRFGIVFRMQFYSPEELMLIIKRAATILSIDLEDEGAREIANRSRGTPRIANRLLKRVRDFAQVMGSGIITDAIASHALLQLHVDGLGLDAIDREVMKTIIYKFNGGPVGVDTIAASVSEERATIEDVYEPYLMQIGFLSRTPRGRIATKAAYDHLGIPWNSERTQGLFDGD